MIRMLVAASVLLVSMSCGATPGTIATNDSGSPLRLARIITLPDTN